MLLWNKKNHQCLIFIFQPLSLHGSGLKMLLFLTRAENNFVVQKIYLFFQTIDDILEPTDELVAKAIQEGINLANNDSESNAKKVQKWRILRKDFSVPGGELGPTLKMKRHIVLQQYAELVDGFYN